MKKFRLVTLNKFLFGLRRFRQISARRISCLSNAQKVAARRNAFKLIKGGRYR
jgi:hypothetical protein